MSFLRHPDTSSRSSSGLDNVPRPIVWTQKYGMLNQVSWAVISKPGAPNPYEQSHYTMVVLMHD